MIERIQIGRTRTGTKIHASNGGAHVSRCGRAKLTTLISASRTDFYPSDVAKLCNWPACRAAWRRLGIDLTKGER